MSIFSRLTRNEGDPKILSSGPRSRDTTDELTRGLGWFSLGLGLFQLVAPHRITRALGVRGSEHVVRAYGAREIASGMLTLSTDKRAGLASRVAGDGLDIVTLLALLSHGNPRRQTAKAALAMVVGIAALDLLAASAVSAKRARPKTVKDYSDRSGFPRGVVGARGIARQKALQDQRASPETTH
ncbi:hypothetical protein [Rhizobium sp. Leaf341]|uniref:hypothetical protein n=1 Tax=Rhizobium sp. Leaf341 TaxID=1736344 RepID=UPI000714AEEC|nr:hypothetical protein [Rhizobium sp. Leaf341]KQR69406.1 hypothetical protein ASG03_09575 [Rhizobium sp. Leaf341]